VDCVTAKPSWARISLDGFVGSSGRRREVCRSLYEGGAEGDSASLGDRWSRSARLTLRASESSSSSGTSSSATINAAMEAKKGKTLSHQIDTPTPTKGIAHELRPSVWDRRRACRMRQWQRLQISRPESGKARRASGLSPGSRQTGHSRIDMTVPPNGYGGLAATTCCRQRHPRNAPHGNPEPPRLQPSRSRSVDGAPAGPMVWRPGAARLEGGGRRLAGREWRCSGLPRVREDRS